MNRIAMASPRTGSSSAPFNDFVGPSRLSGQANRSFSMSLSSGPSSPFGRDSNVSPRLLTSRRRSHSGSQDTFSTKSSSRRKISMEPSLSLTKSQTRDALKENDSMIYLDGPQIFTCAHCRTHLTSHDEIISKSFHGRHGRAYLFEACVNVTVGKAEDRLLITGMHSVCDIFCKRCNTLIGWTYARAYERSQKYKEGKFIVEKINLHLEESDSYSAVPPAGERNDRFRARSISWGSESCRSTGRDSVVYEYMPLSPLEEPFFPLKP